MPVMLCDALRALLTLRRNAARWLVDAASPPQTVAASAQWASVASVWSAGGAAAEGSSRISHAWLPRPLAQGQFSPAAVPSAASADRMARTAVQRTLAVVASGLPSAEGAASSALLSPAGQQRSSFTLLFSPSHSPSRSLALSDRFVSSAICAAKQPPNADKALGCTRDEAQQARHRCNVAAAVEDDADHSRLAQLRSCLDTFAAVPASPGQLGSGCAAVPQPACLYGRQGGWPHPVQPRAAQRGRGSVQHWHLSSPSTVRSFRTSCQPARLQPEARCRAYELHARESAQVGPLWLTEVLRDQSLWRACAGQQARQYATPRGSTGAWSKGFQVPVCS
jgi:hypothetical protein